jgi:glycerol-3-phosphate dehydrogenase
LADIRETDVLVIGGGVNGAGIARDLAGRGLSVILCEKGDLASATSSASSKMLHGGLRYLEHYEFRLVRDALKEREVLLRSAPHIIWPMTFVIPHHKKLRPWWLIRMGLFIYDHLGGRKTLPSSRGRFLPGTKMGTPLKMEFKRGFSYPDGWVEDTRLVVLSALDAAERGADILTRTACTHFVPGPDGGWRATLQNLLTDEKTEIQAKLIVNASGPWVSKTLQLSKGDIGKHKIRWVKGSHIIVPRLYQGDHAYLLQSDPKNVVFVWPYEKRFSLIGTTNVDYTDSLEEVRITMEEVDYLCKSVNFYFRQQITPEDVQWTYAGVRPLVDDGKADLGQITRDYILEMDEVDSAPILSVYGGKITTFRKLSEQAGDKVVARLGKGGAAWTAEAFLPGADTSTINFETFMKTFKREYNWLPEALLYRLGHAYGARARDVLRGSKRTFDLGEHLGDNVYEAEIRYLADVEWALTSEDILWRRSKLGLHVSEPTQENIEKMLQTIMNERAEGR